MISATVASAETSTGHGRPYIFIAYYTVNSGYEAEAQKLKASLRAWNLDYYMEAIVTLGSWKMNIHYKPGFIINCLDKFAPKPAVFVDCDAIVRQYPVLFEALSLMQDDIDLAVHYFRGHELLAGTMFWPNTPTARRLIMKWAEYDKKMLSYKEQKNLQDVLQANPEFKVYRLPPTYTQIFDLMAKEGQPVIEHFQASRRLRRQAGITPREQALIDQLKMKQEQDRAAERAALRAKP